MEGQTEGWKDGWTDPILQDPPGWGWSSKNAASSFEKDVFKLRNNGTFVKAIENLWKRINVRLVNNAKDYKKYVSKPSFVSQKIFSKNVVAVHEIKPILTLDKPIYVRFSVLDLSKLLMYEFHYKYIKTKYNAKLLFADTDSLVYEIKTDDVYEDFYEDKNLFDLVITHEIQSFLILLITM